MNKHNKEDDIYQNPEIKKELEKLRGLDDMSTRSISGVDTDLYNSNKQDIQKIRKTINKVSSGLKKTSGGNIVEFLNAVHNERLSGNRENVDNISSFNNILEEKNNEFSNLIHAEYDRITRYQNYRMLHLNIPELAQSLETYVDNIMSPDDYTKTVFNILLNDVDINQLDKDKYNSKIVKNIENIMDKYEIESKTKKILTNSLKIGDEFVAIFNLREEITRLLNEDGVVDINDLDDDIFINSSSKGHGDFSREITVDDLDITEDEVNLYSEAFNIDIQSKNNVKLTESESLNIDRDNANIVKEDIVNKINKNFKMNNYKYLLEDDIKMRNDFIGEVDNIRTSDIPDEDIESSEISDDELNINGSSIKILNPERVIKLSMDDIVYGYYYFETGHDYKYSNDMSNVTDLNDPTSGLRSNSMDTDIDDNWEKERLINDLFVRGISKKIDKEFVKNHTEFKELIYIFLNKKYISEKELNVVYLSPDQVVHFGDGENEYYDSIYKNILFIAKLYLSVLISTLMTKLVRSPEKRAFYIDTDIDADTEAVVNSFVRDIKSKDISMDNFKDINTVLQHMGTFQDYFIPVFEGQRPVEIDTIQGLHADLDDEFLNFLRNAMVSGMGIPPDFLGMMNQPDFARSLAMQNSKFVRTIIVKQKIYGKQFTELIRILYKNEYGNSINVRSLNNETSKKSNEYGLIDDDEIEKEKKSYTNFSVDDIRVEFPPPSSLNMTNLNEQISNSSQIIDFVTEIVMGQNETSNNPELMDIFRKEISKEVLTTLDWDRYENIYSNSKSKYIANKLDRDKEDEDEDDGSYF